MTENCTNCMWNVDKKCINEDSIYVNGNINNNILCPFYDYKEVKNDTSMGK